MTIIATANSGEPNANDLFLLSPKQRWLLQRNPPNEAIQDGKGQGGPYIEPHRGAHELS